MDINVKLNKAERDMLRIAFLEVQIVARTNILVVDTRNTKANAAARARVAHLAELGFVEVGRFGGAKLSEAGLERGRIEHEAVEAIRRAHLSR